MTEQQTPHSAPPMLPGSLFRVCVAMTSAVELDLLLNLILNLTLEEFVAQRGSILLYEAESDVLQMLASKGMPEEVEAQGYIPRKGSIAEWVIDNNQPVLLNDDVKDDRFTSISERPPRSSICCPLRSHDEVIGVLNISRLEGDLFTDEDVRYMTVMASQAAVSIVNARLQEENVRNARMAAIGQTVSGISHCVKNMLTGLRGGVSLTELGIKDRNWDVIEDSRVMLRRNVDRVSILVMDMLDFSKERAPVRRPIAPVSILNEVAGVIERDAEERRITVNIEADEDMAEVLIDGDQVFRCVLNLAGNAVDACEPDDGVVTLAALLVGTGDDLAPEEFPEGLEGEPAVAVIEVRDNGCGIEPEKIEQIFQPFFSTKGSKGTGIGLAVTQKIAVEHGGRVDLISEPGKGATFRLVLPCSVSDENG